MNVVETHNLTKIYHNRQIALNGLDLTVEQGTVFGLIGPNGAGKTTTIRLLLGLHRPTAGSVRLFGEPMTPNAAGLRRRIGYLPTNPRFPGAMTPITYLDFVGRLSGVAREVRKPRLANLLRALDLLSAASQRIESFSTGMTTRLGIAASLMNDPELIFWDEPTSGLDPEGRKFTIDLIRELGKEKTLLVSSHILSDIERVCDQIGILRQGRLIFSGSLQEMKQLVPAETVRLDLGGDVDGFWQRFQAEPAGRRWRREGNALVGPMAANGSGGAALAGELAHLLQRLAASEATLVAVNSRREDLVDAFIRQLETERAHGFRRILPEKKEDYGFSDPAGS